MLKPSPALLISTSMLIAGLATRLNTMKTSKITTVVLSRLVQSTIFYWSSMPGYAPTADATPIKTPYAMLARPNTITAIVLEMLFIIDMKIPVLPATSGGNSILISIGLMIKVVPKPNPAFKNPAVKPIRTNFIS